LGEGESAATLLSAAEPPVAADSRLNVADRWRWTPERAIEASFPSGASHIFFMTDGRRNPVDQVEAFKAWLSAQTAELGRILCVIDCRLAEQNHPLIAWYDACVHFADVVCLNHREHVANKWFSDFLKHFRGQFLPCLFETPKSGRFANPALVLLPEARRMSLAFDEEQDWVVSETGKDALDDGDVEDGDEDAEVVPAEDPYLARYPGGHRLKQIPDITKYLISPPQPPPQTPLPSP